MLAVVRTFAPSSLESSPCALHPEVLTQQRLRLMIVTFRLCEAGGSSDVRVFSQEGAFGDPGYTLQRLQGNIRVPLSDGPCRNCVDKRLYTRGIVVVAALEWVASEAEGELNIMQPSVQRGGADLDSYGQLRLHMLMRE